MNPLFLAHLTADFLLQPNWLVKKEDFMKLMESSPTMANKISNEFLDRVKKNNKTTL